MGIKVSPDVAQDVSPDVAQDIITKILNRINVVSYIDDCGIWIDTTFNLHIELVGKVQEQLVEAGMK